MDVQVKKDDAANFDFCHQIVVGWCRYYYFKLLESLTCANHRAKCAQLSWGISTSDNLDSNTVCSSKPCTNSKPSKSALATYYTSYKNNEA